MPWILGIDTGGTYTDGVIIDSDGSRKQVLFKAKALTTRHDLALGIRNCIDGLETTDYAKINLVSLSTTLATNAVVEGKGSEVGLLVIGQMPDGKLPSSQCLQLGGRCDIRGKILSNLNEDECRLGIEQLRGKVAAVAVSGYASVRNPAHELAVKRLVREMLAVPVVCAHELTTSLGYHDRTVTAVLNARLISMISELIEAVKRALKEKGICAPIMIVKGDGSLMEASSAQERPIETILSGPAAGVTGGIFLTGMADAILLDMGGTTTDIANVEGGKVKITTSGARVGGWLTRVHSAEIYTYGVGGDSCLRLTSRGKLEVGPQKVYPLCAAGEIYPHLAKEMKEYSREQGYGMSPYQACDCFLLLKEGAGVELSQTSQAAVSLLKQSPHSLFYLTRATGFHADALDLQQLVDLELIGRISLTPTDILHVCGKYNQWNTEAAAAGVQILAERMGKTVEEFVQAAVKAITDRLCFVCLQGMAGFENKHDLLDGEAARYIIEKAFIPEKQTMFGASFAVHKPIVAIGAPVQAWMGDVAQKLHTGLIIPEHAEVASAIGSAVGQVMESVKVLIRPGEGGYGFIMHSPWERRLFDDLAAAVSYGSAEAKKQAAAEAKKAGGSDFDIVIRKEDIYSKIFTSGRKVYLESRIEALALGRPTWGCDHNGGLQLDERACP